MDDFQTRALGNLRKRHEDKIRQHAERIRELTGYVLTRVEGGNAASVGHHAAGIASDAREIITRIAALEAIEETAGILGASSAPVAECGYCTSRITLLGGSWTSGDGTIACTDTSAPFVPHKPKEG